MRIRLQRWQGAALVMVVLIAAGAGALERWRTGRQPSDRELLSMLPARGAVLLYINAGALRQAGILDLLAGSKAAEEADYREFVAQTGFDYRTDLEAIAGSFTGEARYFALRGRFQWKRLANYATMQGGECRDSVCTVPGSTAERNVSFFPLHGDVLTIAFARDPRAVTHINTELRTRELKLPAEPVWVLIPGSLLTSGNFGLVGALLAPLDQLARVREVRLAAGSAGPSNGKQLQVDMSVECASAQDALRLKNQLAKSDDAGWLASLLALGTFTQDQAEVRGVWHLDPSALQAIVGN